MRKMKKANILTALLVFLLVTASGVVYAGDRVSVTLMIEGMSCRLCAPAVRKALLGVEGVEKAEVDYSGKKAYVVYIKGGTTVEELRGAVKDLGFSAKPEGTE